MKVKFWGTAAAEGIPSVFCACPVCKEAREKGGKYQRARAQVMIDDELLVDFNADTYMNSLRWGYDLSKLEHVLITHNHTDHFYPQELFNRQNEFCYDMAHETINWYGSPWVMEKYFLEMQGGQFLIEQNRVALNKLYPYKKYKIGSFEVIPLPATHSGGAYVYLISKADKTVFYCNDCGTMSDEVFEWLENSGVKLDLVIYDCTHAMRDTYNEDGGKYRSHMGQPNNIYTRTRLAKAGLYKSGTIDVETHFSHNGRSVGYGDFEPLAKKAGFICAYDGMELDI